MQSYRIKTRRYNSQTPKRITDYDIGHRCKIGTICWSQASCRVARAASGCMSLPPAGGGARPSSVPDSRVSSSSSSRLSSCPSMSVSVSADAPATRATRAAGFSSRVPPCNATTCACTCACACACACECACTCACDMCMCMCMCM